MALITDPDSLNDSAINDSSAEVFIDTAALRLTLNQTGNLTTDGATLKALYSFLKEEWRNDPHGKNLPSFAFPMVPITDESFELVDGWDFVDASTQELIRTSGWTVRNSAGNETQGWAGTIGLGSVDGSDQPYFDQGVGRQNYALGGQVNQAVQIFSDPNGDGSFTGGFDRRAEFTIFLREQGKVFAAASLADIGVTTMQPIAYRFPLSTSADVKIATADTGIDSDSNGVADVAPFDGMSITFHGTAQQRAIGGTDRDFGVIIDGNNGTKEQIYEYVQWALRQPVDADSDSDVLLGDVAPAMLEFVGDTLNTLNAANPDGGGDGVFIDNFLASDQNNLVFRDNSESERTFPRTAAIILQPGANLINDADAKYWIYFADPDGSPDGDEWGTAGGVLVPDTSAVAMTGDIAAQAEIQIAYDYDGDTTSGRTPGTDVPVVAVAIGLDTGQYVRAQGTISFPSTTIALVPGLERNYENAA